MIGNVTDDCVKFQLLKFFAAICRKVKCIAYWRLDLIGHGRCSTIFCFADLNMSLLCNLYACRFLSDITNSEVALVTLGIHRILEQFMDVE